MTKPHLRRALGIGSIAISLTLIGCTTPTDDAPTSIGSTTPRWPATDTYEVPEQIRNATMVWSAEPGIDLHSTEGTLIRATEESDAIATILGLKYAYLGFAESTSSTIGRVMGDYEDDTGRGPFAGTIHARILEIVPTATGFDAAFCLLSVGLDELRNGKYFPSRLADGQGSEIYARYTHTGSTPSHAPVHTSPPPAPAPERLNWQAPTGNEFVGWAVKIDFNILDTKLREAEKDRCNPWAQSLFPGTTTVIPRDAYARDNPPTSQPAYPGWPDAPL